jgi:hypothetical protein
VVSMFELRRAIRSPVEASQREPQPS